jgi:hypothetical protein
VIENAVLAGGTVLVIDSLPWPNTPGRWRKIYGPRISST